MLLPNNGKVVIIDDKIDQVSKLMQVLSQQKVPFTYFQDENGEDLPDSPLKNVRIVFLDLMLQADIAGLPEKSIISTALSRLTAVIGEENGPYFLFVWSTEYDRYSNALMKEINSDGFKEYKPFSVIPLAKSQLNKYGVEVIFKALTEAINEMDSLKIFLLWESLINNSVGEITNNLTTIIHRDGNWNQNTKNLLFRLASAYLGKRVDENGDEAKIAGACSTLNQTLLDQIEMNISSCNLNGLSGIIERNENESLGFVSKINTQLHFSNQIQDNKMPGCVYATLRSMSIHIENAEEAYINHIESLPAKIKDNPVIIEKKGGRHKKELQLLIDEKKAKMSAFNSIISESLEKEFRDVFFELIREKSIYIELNISPQCDHVQKKMKMSRLLPGILIPSEFCGKINKNADYSYLSNFSFNYKDISYSFLFDYRYMYSVIPLSIKCSPIFRIKENLLNELQVKLSSHINRLGVLYMS